MLRSERKGSVLHLILDRPEVRNAFNDELIGKLYHVFSNLDPGVRAVVLSGEGKAFSAGGDLDWMRRAADYTEEQNFEDALKLAKLFDSIVKCPAVVIARVHGAAFGGGCGLVACADVAICEPETKFAFSEVRLGLLPATISPFVIPKIGHGHARALFSTGETFGAERALRIGLVHEIATPDGLERAVDEKLKAVLSAGPAAAYSAKRIAQEGFGSLEDAAWALARARSSEEGKEGVAAFLDKRKARFVEDL
jgi:enoyl-CoA hydratase/carnithine racemase